MKDTLKNKSILIQFLLFPVMTIIMENTMEIKDMPEHFFAALFAVMYLGMAPLTAMASILSEEKEKNTLRILFMSNVKAWEYLLGIGLYIWILCMVGSFVMGYAGNYSGIALWDFLVIMGMGIMVSVLIGAVIGVASKNQMKGTSIAVPVTMIFAFFPMLSMFNEGIAKVGKFTYTEQIHKLLNQAGNIHIEAETICIMGGNLLLAGILFVFAYKRSGLE